MFEKSWRILIDLICVVSGSPFVESFIFLFWFHYFLKIEDILRKLKYYNTSHWEEELIPQTWNYITPFSLTGRKSKKNFAQVLVHSGKSKISDVCRKFSREEKSSKNQKTISLFMYRFRYKPPLASMRWKVFPFF